MINLGGHFVLEALMNTTEAFRSFVQLKLDLLSNHWALFVEFSLCYPYMWQMSRFHMKWSSTGNTGSSQSARNGFESLPAIKISVLRSSSYVVSSFERSNLMADDVVPFDFLGRACPSRDKYWFSKTVWLFDGWWGFPDLFKGATAALMAAMRFAGSGTEGKQMLKL